MIEVPSAVIIADVLAREAEFFSIGTNDLIQYTLAIDRGNRSMAHLASFHPAILRMIRQVARAVGTPYRRRSAARWPAIRSPPVMLVGLGIRELSMEAAAIPDQGGPRRVTTVDCERTAESALKLDTADAVEELIAGTFAPALFDLLESDEDTYDAGVVPPDPGSARAILQTPETSD